MIIKIVWRATLKSSAPGTGKVKRRKKFAHDQEHIDDEMA